MLEVYKRVGTFQKFKYGKLCCLGSKWAFRNIRYKYISGQEVQSAFLGLKSMLLEFLG